ncbi:hypothetical protein [Flavobacterium xueshanense]|nr:hypothetical protein [Flavobacterium xueshanense]
MGFAFFTTTIWFIAVGHGIPKMIEQMNSTTEFSDPIGIRVLEL